MRVDPHLAWQVFQDAFTPTPELKDRIKSLVARLDADQFKQREAASRELESLGEPAALVLMHWDRSGLSAEQASRIDAFVAKFRVDTDDQVAHLRHDRDFLLDCLNSEDATIRAVALGELQKIVGHPIGFDVNADPLARREKVNALLRNHGLTDYEPAP